MMKDFSIHNLFLPLAILVGAVIFGSFYYTSETNKQRSIERQQISELKLEKQQNCFAMYKTESDKYKNVIGWKYDEDIDWCEIEYKDTDTGTTFTKRYY